MNMMISYQELVRTFPNGNSRFLKSMNELYSFIVMGISSYSNPLPRNVIVYSAPLSLRLKLIRNLSMALTVSFFDEST